MLKALYPQFSHLLECNPKTSVHSTPFKDIPLGISDWVAFWYYGQCPINLPKALPWSMYTKLWVRFGLPVEYLPYQVSRRGGSGPPQASLRSCILGNRHKFLSSRRGLSVKSTGPAVSSSLLGTGATLITLEWAFEWLRPISRGSHEKSGWSS